MVTGNLGWNTVLFASGEAQKEIYSTHNYLKGPFYDALQALGENTFNTRSRSFHKTRKRMLMGTFNTKTIEAMEPTIINEGISILINILTNHHADQENPADLYLLFGSMTLDVVGAISFGIRFNSLTKGTHPIVNWLGQSVKYTVMQFFFPPIKYFRNPGREKIKRFSFDAVMKSKQESQGKSLIYQLINEVDGETGHKLSDLEVANEAELQM